MALKGLVSTVVCGLCPALLLTGTVIAQPQQDRVSATEKGSVIILSNIELKWDAAGALTQDTFIQFTNDNTTGVEIQGYFINGDPPLAAVPGGERAHPGWNAYDNGFPLTANQPTYWSAATGTSRPGSGANNPPSLSPFTVLDPGVPPGRPDPDGGTGRVLRGFAILWAVNDLNEQIKWNHLAANVTIVNYADGSAWEYNGWSFQCVNAALATGAVCGVAGTIAMNGVDYAPSFDQLLMNFQAVGATAFSGPRLVTSNTDLTLHLVDADLRQGGLPKCTKAVFDIWNMNEVKFSGAERCFCCWEQRLLGNWAPLANHFLRANLQTDVGKARIDGHQSTVCLPTITGEYSLLGVVSTRLVFDAGVAIAEAGTNLHGMGIQNAVINYTPLGALPAPATSPENVIDEAQSIITRGLQGLKK